MGAVLVVDGGTLLLLLLLGGLGLLGVPRSLFAATVTITTLMIQWLLGRREHGSGHGQPGLLLLKIENSSVKHVIVRPFNSPIEQAPPGHGSD